jgi:hypothetical protein
MQCLEVTSLVLVGDNGGRVWVIGYLNVLPY